jgi:hypothetical protein
MPTGDTIWYNQQIKIWTTKKKQTNKQKLIITVFVSKWSLLFTMRNQASLLLTKPEPVSVCFYKITHNR